MCCTFIPHGLTDVPQNYCFGGIVHRIAHNCGMPGWARISCSDSFASHASSFRKSCIKSFLVFFLILLFLSFQFPAFVFVFLFILAFLKLGKQRSLHI